ncbi:MAG: saccharopine dehydrogenase [Bacteroidetes bacterium HGW-Bacteroidetes-16]|jgi:saccharopine dehydrogenase-like NADP-dependent oxidoreductase|nr:MAG: saccharopine dehydrogenase [Bacteroidetes bacterium HGW-Bacteroidetes-16]
MKKNNIVVLGAGLVGKPIAVDLAQDANCFVTLVDINPPSQVLADRYGIKLVLADLSKKSQVVDAVQEADFVVNAVPGFMGFNVLKQVIEAGKDAVDIAFYPENPMDLDELAKKQGVRVICDMGVAPGMSHLLVGHFANQLDHVERADIFVGGLPKIRTQPWEYKAVFSPVDVLEEYTRPARLVEHGQMVIKPALTEVENLEFEGLGTLEAFNSDGLRSLVYTLKADVMREKTLRYPGYTAKVKLLADAGFFNPVKMRVGGVEISPLSLTSQLLFDQWKLHEGEEDMTIMRIVVEGSMNGVRHQFVCDLHDEYDPISNVHSMARTTGYAASVALRWLMSSAKLKKGITLPEKLAMVHGSVDYILAGLAERNVNYKFTHRLL